MLKRLSVMFVLILFGTLVLTGCSSSSGDVYLGNWVNVEKGRAATEIKIEKRDNYYVVSRTVGVAKLSNKATVKDDVLEVDEGMGSIQDIKYQKSDDTITLNKDHFKREGK
jgi:hypothetical protein